MRLNFDFGVYNFCGSYQYAFLPLSADHNVAPAQHLQRLRELFMRPPGGIIVVPADRFGRKPAMFTIALMPSPRYADDSASQRLWRKRRVIGETATLAAGAFDLRALRHSFVRTKSCHQRKRFSALQIQGDHRVSAFTCHCSTHATYISPYYGHRAAKYLARCLNILKEDVTGGVVTFVWVRVCGMLKTTGRKADFNLSRVMVLSQ